MSKGINTHPHSPPEPAGEVSSLVEILLRRAEEQPERVAYTFLVEGEAEERHLTYGELDRQARAVGAWLQAHGSEGERVLLVYPSGLQFVSAFFGCLYAGAVAVSTHVPRLKHSLSRLQAIVGNAEAKFLLAPAQLLSKVDSFKEHAPSLESLQKLATDRPEAVEGLADAWKRPAVGRETLAFLQYTSGSTSTPKGVMVTHGNVIHNAAELNASYDYTPQSVSVAWVPHFHDLGLIFGIIQPLVQGCRGILIPPAAFLQRPLRWLETMTRYRGTHTSGPNSAFDLCVRRSSPEQRAALDLSSWRVALNGAEPLHPATLERFTEAFAPCGFRWEVFKPGYGLAEATLKVTTRRAAEAPVLKPFDADALSANRASEVSADSPNARLLVGSGHTEGETLVRIVNPETLVECRPEEIGEVWISGPIVAEGYWKRPEETERTFRARLAGTSGPAFLRTGDLGFLDGGELFVAGRLKDLIIINGRNHYPQDIEKTVEEAHPLLREACSAAFSVEAEENERLVVVAEVSRHFRGRRDEADEIFASLRRAIAEQHELNVSDIVLLKTGKILKTTSGKIQRRACREAFLKGTLETRAQWPPRPEGDARGVAEPEEVAEGRAGSATTPGVVAPRPSSEIAAWLIEKLASYVRVEARDLNPEQPFTAFGLSSLQSVSLSGELAEWLGRPLPATLLYDYPTLASLSKFLSGERTAAHTQAPGEDSRPEAPDGAAEPVAIIGIGCRFPGADNAEAFWQLLRRGVDAVTEYPSERRRAGDRVAEANGHPGGFIEGVGQFDAHFFSVSPREAPHLDPQQRLLLEVAWEALENAGQSPAKLAGSQTGVFVGIGNSDYRLLRTGEHESRAPYAATGTSYSIAANRLSYFLDLHGPSIALDTACSSSLVAVHLACQSIRRGESGLALAGGVNLILNPALTEDLSRAGMLSPEGRCKVFDAEANGYVRAEGCGIVVLKKLSEAERDGDNVIALIRGSAVNQDGRSNGLTAPNGRAQQAVIRRALEAAAVSPAEVSFVETHGSGTSLGDPIEVNSLISVLGAGRSGGQPCALGSVKANVGHLEAAAGVAGLIKAALALQRAEIPPQLHLRNINPHLLIADTPFSIPSELLPWPASAKRRRAGVSSFGFGGTNAHVVLEQAPPAGAADEAAEEAGRPVHLLTLSARSESALRDSARRYGAFLREHSELSLADVCFTANAGRSHFSQRLALVCGSPDECLEKLTAFLDGRAPQETHVGRLRHGQRTKLAFLFDGEEASDEVWARGLYSTQPAFRRALDLCDELLCRMQDSPREPARGEAPRLLSPGVEPRASRFAFDYALAQTWLSWGVKPDAVTGRGVGEYVAACVAGVLTLEDGFGLALESERAAGGVRPKPARIPIISARTGRPLSSEEAADAGHWRRAGEGRPQIGGAVAALEENGYELCLSFGPPPPAEAGGEASGAKTLKRLPARGDWRELLRTLARLYVEGVEIAWDDFDGPYRRRRVCLPTYPFERQRYWLDAPQVAAFGEGTARTGRGGEMFERRSTEAPHGTGEVSEETPARGTTQMPTTEATTEARQQEIRLKLCGIVADLLGMRPEDIDPHAPFLEMGADSIILVTAIRTIENSFGIKISMRQLFEDFTNIDALARHFAQFAPSAAHDLEAPAPKPEPAARVSEVAPPVPQAKAPSEDAGSNGHSAPDSDMERIIRMQLDAFTHLTAQQWEFFKQNGGHAPSAPAQREANADAERPRLAASPQPARAASPDASQTVREPPAAPARVAPEPVEAESAALAPAPYVPYKRITPGTNGGLGSRQAKHLEALIARFTKRTQKSKQLAERARPRLADSRASVGFRLSVKEMLYPITGARSAGSRIWDIDGNEYIDVTMGFGVHLFGHRAPFIQEALEEQLRAGTQLGPRVEYVEEVAQLLCELTGHDRVTFCNSGTEAVMTALRLARAATGRSRVAIFSGSYHGHSDGTLAIAEGHDGDTASIPMAPGVPSKVAEDIVVLEYGSPRALDYLRAHARELAAVLVEPVQSRNPGLQPRAFLHELRELTKAAGTTLIFDEMVTGLRVHNGGAQAVFGVEADLATYGKIVGGGMPIGAVAGAARFMNGIDGGVWAYGDASYPKAETTFFGGTFCMHPLAMSAALATLRHLKREGPELQRRLNERTSQLAAGLNAYFEGEELPLRIANFGSLFRFVHSGNMDLFYYHLLERGIYIWEWRSCFLSTAHTPQDFDDFARSIKDSLAEMREGGLLPERPAPLRAGAHGPDGDERASPSEPDARALPGDAAGHVPPDAEGTCGLSDAQKQLWLLAQMSEEASLAYHESVVIELEGALDLERLRGAFRAVLERHEALRTGVESEGERQRILPGLDFEVPLVDFSSGEASERRAALDAWLRDEARRPFELGGPPLLRVYALRLEERKHLLALFAHHIIIDSWSLSLILREASGIYSAGVEGRTCELPSPMQFREYLRGLSEPAYLRRLRQAEGYWLAQLSGEIPPLALTSHRPPVKRYRGAKTSMRIDAALAGRLKTYGRRQGCTLFMTLFAGYSALLHRLTGQEEVVVGIPVSGRFIDGSESVVGYCTHLLPVLSRLAPSARFEEHLRSNRSTLLDAYEHQEYPFARLIQLLNPSRDLSRTPIIQTTFNLEPNFTLPAFAGLEPALVSSPLYYTKFDLGVNVLDVGGELRVEFDYDPDLLGSAFVERLAGQFQLLLEGALGRAGEPLAGLPLMSEAERRRLLVEWNATRAPLPREALVHELVEAQARRTPEATAVVFHDGQLSYRELNDRANRLAHHLRGLGLEPEARVAVCVERSPEMLTGLLAVLKAGCAYVPLDAEYPRERLAYMLADCGASVLLTTRGLSGLFAPGAHRVVELDALRPSVADESAENPPPTATADNLAYVIYTSGSTGRPKGVQVTHGAVVNLLASMQRLPGLGAGDSLLAVTTACFDISVLELFLPLAVGARLLIADRDEAKDGERLSQILTAHGVNAMQATPATWRLLLAAGWAGSPALKVLCGGEALPRELAEELAARSASVWNMYGPTETTIWSAVESVEPGAGAVSIGRPIANTQTYVLDGGLQPVPPGVAGELYIAGAGLSRGYLNRPDITAEKFVPHPFADGPGLRLYRTGDLARYREDGKLELIGRADHQVKLRGFRIELGEIEAALGEHSSVAECVVVVREDEPDNQRLVAYVVSRAGRRATPGELSAHLGQSLPEYMVPSAFVTLDALPRYPNGKVNRASLPAAVARAAGSKGDAPPRTELEQGIAAIWREVLKVERVGLYDNFFDLGGHSLLLTKVHLRLKEATGLSFPVMEMFRHPTVATLAGFLSDGRDAGSSPSEEGRPASNRPRARKDAGTEVAIIGMAGRFPGAATVEEFWRNLRGGVESVTFFTDEELQAEGVEPSLLREPGYVRAGAVLEGVELFDANFFGFSPREAEVTDPQHRLFLECAWEALENAGYDAERVKGAVGVYAAVGLNTYLLFNLGGHRALSSPSSAYQTFIGNDKDFVPTRVSYKLNLKGPSVNVQTACSSSLVAVHMACRSLLEGECDMTLVGGVAVKVPVRSGYLHDEQGIDSPDGHCRAFDARAAGTVFGSGAGVVVLKRLSDALRDRDDIHAVIRGSAVNNDGSLKVSYTAPSEDGQAEVVRAALEVAGVEPQTIGYVEAHGTGTHLGDPIEVAALTKAFASRDPSENRCAIGSVKTNIGHLDTAAGIAGLIKAALSLRHGELPPSLHFEEPNPQIDFARTPFYVNQTVRPWETTDAPRRAGVSSFGIGGTNAHVILEEAPERPAAEGSRPWQLLTLSAKTPTALDALTANLAAHLKSHPETCLADAAYTLQLGRRRFEHRRVVVCRDAREAVAAVERPDARRVFTRTEESKSRPVVFLFPGQGTQHVEMARGVYEAEPSFRRTVDECSELLRPHLKLDLRGVLYPREEGREEAAQQLNQTQLAQPALFVVEYALARLWMEWGVEPRAMLGHSIGEYAAACLAGLFSLEDALALVAARGRLMQGVRGGAMLAVPLAEDEARKLLGRDLSLAAVNGASQCVISGETFAVERLESELSGRGVRAARLQTSHAFHSAMMEPMLERFAAEAARVRFGSPRIPWLSSLTGDWVAPEEAAGPRYWVRQLRETVRFADGLDKLLASPHDLLLEVGPGQSLGAQIRRHPGRQPAQQVVSSMRHKEDPDSDAALLLTALGRLWLAGVTIDWAAFSAHERRRRVPLPTYPFERRRYWVDPPKSEEPRGELQAPRKSPDLSRWFYLPCWKPGAPLPRRKPEAEDAPPRLLVFTAENSFCRALLKRLEERRGDRVNTVVMGEGFARLGERAYALNPGRAEDYRRLVEALRLGGELPDKVLHLWNVSAGDEARAESPDFEAWQRAGFESLLNLAKALGEGEEESELVVVSTNLHNVNGTEELLPEKATLLAPCKTIPQEFRQLACRSVDLTPPEAGSPQERRLTDQLIAELETRTRETVVAYRNGARWVQSFEATGFAEPAGEGVGLREGGVYLITGGLGKIGLTLARHLAAATRGRLALVARTPLPRREDWDDWLKSHGEDETSEKIRGLVALRESGAEVSVYAADVTDEGRMRAVVAQIEEELGRINGVVHAAGSLPEQTFRLIRDSGGAALDWRHDPKLQGVVVLERVLAGREIDFCLLVSSLASVLGGIGYSTYGAANLFMDAFAHKLSRRGDARWMSVNWDAWAFEGEARPGAGFGASLAGLSMTAEEGAEVFRRLLSAEPVTQVVVSTADLAGRLDRWINLRPRRAEQEERGARPSLHPRPTLAASYVAPETETEKAVADIWRQLLGIEQVGVRDDFFALGGDSLLAVQLASRLRASFKLEVGPRELFNLSTVAALAEVVEAGRTLKPQADELRPLEPVSRGGLLPLSSAQRRLWTVCQLGRGETAYNLPTATLLRGPLDADALEKSLNEIVRRHEALRASFPTVDGQPLAFVAPQLSLSLPLIDLSGLPPEQRPARALKLADEEVRKPFDLTKGPLLRAQLARTGAEEHVLLLTMHHIVTDGWSMGVIIGELAALYDAYSRGAASPLPELTIQYFDIAEWQRQALRGERLASLLDYWKGQLGATPPKLELPTDRPRAGVKTFRGATLPVGLPHALVGPLKALGLEEKATLFMTLLAAFDVLLRHHAGADKVAVGTDVANRTRAESEALIGFFVNQLVLLTDLSGDPTFRTLLGRVRETALGAFAHQELPFELLVDALKPEREASDSPLFQVKFVLQNAPQPPLQLTNLSISPLEVENPYAKFDLLLTLWESADGLKGTFEYRAELFDAATVEGLLLDYELILRAVAGEPDISLSALDGLLAESRRRRSLDRAEQVKASAQAKLKNVRRRPVSAGTK
jgi:polyketide synthase PksJ